MNARRPDNPVGILSGRSSGDAVPTPAWQWAVAWLVLLSAGASPGRADSARELVQQGNRLYAEGQYSEAFERYEQAQAGQAETMVPQFNQAASQYRLEELGRAMELYQEVAARSKDPALVAKAKYNLGNCLFQRGVEQAASNPQKALEDLKTSVGYWRQVRDLDPQNARAARNMEIAKRTIQQILEQQKQQQQQQDQQKDDQKKEQEQQGDQQQQQDPSPQDPNEPQDPNDPQQQPSAQDPNQPQPEDPNESQPPQPQEQGEEKEQQLAPDATAQEILDREQRLKEQRDVHLKGRYQEVEKDW